MAAYLLQHLLRKTAHKYPDKIAIQAETREITYEDLDRKSNCLAHMLTGMGFAPRNPVVIYLEKSIEAIISLFGILKAGGIYVPLDPEYSPAARVKHVLDLCETDYVVTSSTTWNHFLEGLPETEKKACSRLNILFIDEFKFFQADQSSENGSGFTGEEFRDDSRAPVDPGIIDEDPAYILYTSGSTGIPKGVVLTHLNALTFINWGLSTFNPAPDDVFSNFASLGFDLSVFDIYVSIASGGCLKLVPPRLMGNPRLLVNWISESKITYMYSVPSIWVMILNYARVQPNAFGELKNILFAGEVFPPKYLRMLMELLPHVSFYNLYGPTETNVCTFYHVKGKELVADQPVPIGKACSNTEVVALSDGKPIAVGEEGELYVRGSIVTRGYYRDPARTEAAFIKSPILGDHGALLYKTGDLVKKLDQDLYEYRGRIDLMVKRHGFRIELQEIENALLQNEKIKEAAAVSVTMGEKELSGIYVVVTVKEPGEFSVIELKNFLADILPKYMIPDGIQLMDEIPRNPNGKIDRPKVSRWLMDNWERLND